MHRKKKCWVLENSSLIGWLRGLHFSIIVFDVTSTILGLVFLLSLFYFIYLFIYFFLSIKKAPKRKTNNFHSLKKFCARKKLLLLLFFVRLIFLVSFGLICIFYAQNLFVKKKKRINRHKIVLITSNAISLMLIPIGHVTLDVW